MRTHKKIKIKGVTLKLGLNEEDEVKNMKISEEHHEKRIKYVQGK